MNVNFEIEDNYAVEFEGRHIDLHNNFQLVEIRDQNEIIEIEFEQSEGNWVASDELSKLTFIFTRVNYKYEEAGENDSFPDDWNVLGELSFFPNNMRDVNDGIIPQKIPNENDDIIFFFENGRLIRINAKNVELIVE